MKLKIFDNLKNIPGWSSKRKLVVISIDDYGNVRLDSKKARQAMDKAGMKIYSRFDAYDALETKEDLESMFEVLTSVKDKWGNSAVITPYTLPCNIDFEAMAANKYQEYRYEYLPDTFNKLASKDSKSYESTWGLWQEGIDKRLLKPQFHGREHLNLSFFEDKLKEEDHELITALKNRSFTSISSDGFNYTAAFDIRKTEETDRLTTILKDGIDAFEKVFGFPSDSFTPPAQKFPEDLKKHLNVYGIRNLDRPFVQNVDGKRIFNKLQHDKNLNLTIVVRNVVFEPTENRGFDWVSYSLKQIERSFRWNKPAHISSHRVNYCGHIDPENRKKGLTALSGLLNKIIEKWPDVEFITVDELGDIIRKESNNDY